MRERYLFLKKEITKYSDMYEHLPLSYREKLSKYEDELAQIKGELTDDDLMWVDEEFGKWYEKYIVYETISTIRLFEG
ncbi:MAG: hypothetical protein PWQ25_346 [Deferribacteres bacterium]|jgi:hypothetical protein|nr:hypothetical protein [Deferribacteres bacterium]